MFILRGIHVSFMVENLREKALKAYEAIFNNQDTVEINGDT
jgi:hypothetical protein